VAGNQIELKTAAGSIKGDKFYVWIFPYLGRYEKPEDMRIEDIPQIILDRMCGDSEDSQNYAGQIGLMLLMYSYGKFYDKNSAEIPESIFNEYMQNLQMFVSFSELLKKGYFENYESELFGGLMRAAIDAVHLGMDKLPIMYENISVVLNPEAVKHHRQSGATH
jgi:hypothetical protein